MRALTRKLFRDTHRLAGQLASIALVVACGIAAMVAMRGNYDSLLLSRDAYYERHRFADLFVGLRRAPDEVARRIARLPGVVAVEPRLSAYVILDVPEFGEPVTGHLLSLPADPQRGLNAPYLRTGRLPAPGAPGEVLVSEVFAAAHGLVPGDRLAAVINGRWQDLAITGVGLSPEFIYEVGPGQVFPDNARFGVAWMGRDALAAALDQEGAFNDLTLDLAPGAAEPDIIAAVDRLLAPYGGTGAVPRRDQVSNAFLEDELVQHRVTGSIIGGLFLAVAAFLVNLVLARLVHTEREEIGTLKAFGYANPSLVGHYLGLAAIPVAGGLALGWGAGLWLGKLFTELFARYYHFPVLRYVATPGTLALAGVICAIAAAAGALQALRAVVRLPPAEAMRPPAPARFRQGFVERLRGLGLGLATRMALRSALRRPVTSLLTITGIAFAAALLVLGRYFTDAMNVIAEVQFRLVQQQDVTVTFREVMPGRAVTELGRLPGVVTAEGVRTVGVELRHASRRVRTAVQGLAPEGRLQRLVDAERRSVALPVSGLVINRRLAARLGIVVGDALELVPLEGSRAPRTVVVAEVFDEMLGLSGYMRRDELNRLLGEGPVVTGALLGTDGTVDAQLAARLKALPAVAGAGFKGGLVASFERTLAESMGISTMFLTGFACVIALAVAYNGLRIAFSERRRELASLRVLGFGSREVATVLIAEQGLLTLAALPVGALLGYGFGAALSHYYVTDLFRIPLVLEPRSYAMALGVILLATAAGALLMLRQVARLDLVEALKTRE